jgi:hypothetical protein
VIRSFCACLALVLLAAGCNKRIGTSQEPDWERNAVDAQEKVREQETVLPPYPQSSDLLEFSVGPTGSHRYFIDARSLQMGADGVARYAVVVRTTGGASNTAYEGIRCKTYERRTYAFGHPQGKWIEAKRSDWQRIGSDRADYHVVLYREYLCRGEGVANREDALHALRFGPVSPILR